MLNVYILTNNNYLYLGLSEMIKIKYTCKCSALNKNKSKSFLSDYIPATNDIFIVSIDIFSECFNYILNARDAGVTIIVINDLRHSSIASVFGVISIPYYFNIEELLNRINKRDFFNFSQYRQAPRLTERERMVLFNIKKGQGVRCISDSMGISEKTVYSYLAIIMRKIGLRNRGDIGLLSSVYINYLCTGEQSRVVY